LTAIDAYPKVQWQVIINPSSGPGTVDSQFYPTDPTQIAGIAKLNSYPNVITLGYIHTNYGQRTYSEVTSEVDVYARWTSYSKANISISGIFFDEISNNPSSDVYKYYQQASAYVYAKFSSAVKKVMFNPGTYASIQLFEICDTMFEFENPFSNYGNDTTIEKIPGDYRGKSGIMVDDVPASADVGSLVHTMAYYGVEAYMYSRSCPIPDRRSGQDFVVPTHFEFTPVDPPAGSKDNLYTMPNRHMQIVLG